MPRSPAETALEFIPRDTPVKAAGLPDRTTVSARLGQGLQRLYAPAGEGQPERIGQLLTQLHGQLAEDGQRSLRRARGRKDRPGRR